MGELSNFRTNSTNFEGVRRISDIFYDLQIEHTTEFQRNPATFDFNRILSDPLFKKSQNCCIINIQINSIIPLKKIPRTHYPHDTLHTNFTTNCLLYKITPLCALLISSNWLPFNRIKLLPHNHIRPPKYYMPYTCGAQLIHTRQPPRKLGQIFH